MIEFIRTPTTGIQIKVDDKFVTSLPYTEEAEQIIKIVEQYNESNSKNKLRYKVKKFYQMILEKWFYKDNEKVVRLRDIMKIFEDLNEEGNYDTNKKRS